MSDKEECRHCGELEKHLQTCIFLDSGCDGERSPVLDHERVKRVVIAPERIWLQRTPDGSLDNRIWTKGDIEYVRAEVSAGLRATLDAFHRENNDLLNLINDLADTGECRLDHHGYCQEHAWMETSECPHARARKLSKNQ